MKCQNCQFINPDDGRFCQNCGKPLERPCWNCGTLNSPQAKFCKKCGSSLAGRASEEPSQSRFAAVIPSALMEKARSSAHVSGERRIVTALFADVVGSTALAEQMDPEDWTTLMNRAFDLLTPVIYHYEGTIARLMGDALLAFFGAPIAHEDDPIRAAHAALDMLRVAGEYARELRTRLGIDFAIRVGMNTGPAVVGEVGSSLIYEYTAMGDAVNLAARMQSAADPMTVLITENTQRYLAQSFLCTDRGRLEVKGKAEPVHVYELVQPIEQAAGARRLNGLESAMVGREEELATLLRLGQAVQAGLGRAALVIGEPGIGKSRLVAEWKARLVGPPELPEPRLGWVEGRCLSYGQGMAYHLLVDLLRSILRVQASADSSETMAALETLCDGLFGAEAIDVFPYLGHLLSLPLESQALERIKVLDPQALQAQYLSSLRRLLTGLAQQKPLVIILDDLHWADPSSVDLLSRLLPAVLEARILACLVTRAERDVPGWKLVTTLREQLGPGLAELPLRALTDEESGQLVNNLLASNTLPPQVFNLILGKTEGNPLFVEEVIRMLMERGVLTRREESWQAAREIETVEIPDNLQSLLLARIDRLPEEVKRTLRVAAVIGRQFSLRVLEEVLKRQEASEERERI